MVMSTLPPAPASAPATASSAANDLARQPNDLQWASIIQQLGAEIAGPLSAAMEGIQSLIDTGQIDRQSLRKLHGSVGQARAAGMLGQQLARLASGRMSLTHERQHLTQMLRGVITQRSGETQARGIQVRQVLRPVEVLADGALLFSLLDTMMDWVLAQTHSSIDLRLDLTPWPAKARLTCRFAHRSLDLLEDPPRPGDAPPQRGDAEFSALNSLTWRLLEQNAVTLGVLPLRESAAGITVLTLEFPHTVSDEPAVAARTPSDNATTTPAPSLHSRPLAGKHLLILTARRNLQAQIQTAVQHLGLIVDTVETVDEAFRFCAEGLPHAVVFDAGQRSTAFSHLHAEVMREVPDISFVEVLLHEQQTQLSTATADGMARISLRYITDALPSVLTFELSKGH